MLESLNFTNTILQVCFLSFLLLLCCLFVSFRFFFKKSSFSVSQLMQWYPTESSNTLSSTFRSLCTEQSRHTELDREMWCDLLTKMHPKLLMFTLSNSGSSLPYIVLASIMNVFDSGLPLISSSSRLKRIL